MKTKKEIKEKDMILRLQTKNWNKLSSKEQDRAVLFMLRVLSELSRSRKHGYCDEFFAQYP